MNTKFNISAQTIKDLREEAKQVVKYADEYRYNQLKISIKYDWKRFEEIQKDIDIMDSRFRGLLRATYAIHGGLADLVNPHFTNDQKFNEFIAQYQE